MRQEEAIAKLKAHLVKHGFGHIEVIGEARAEPPYKISAKEPMAQAVIAAVLAHGGNLLAQLGVQAEGALGQVLRQAAGLPALAQYEAKNKGETEKE
jgi:hypothetical protein